VGSHPNIIQIFSYGDLGLDWFYIDMEYCLGTLADIIDGQAASKFPYVAADAREILTDMEKCSEVFRIHDNV